jgi:hypothetical protein
MGHNLSTISNAQEGTLFKSNIKVNLYAVDKKFKDVIYGFHCRSMTNVELAKCLKEKNFSQLVAFP